MESKTLNPLVWDAKKELHKPIRDRLLKIAHKFLEEIETEITIKNIFLTGSLCSYEWSADSDWDLHIVAEPQEDYCGEDTVEDYFLSKSKIFNKDHNIFIKGYPVEINIKEKEGLFKDKAVYDLIKNDWVAKPEHPSVFLNNTKVMKKAAELQSEINNLVNHEGSIAEVKALRNKVKEMRQTGLEEDGEFSIGNLVFKTLRHTGYIKKLYDYKSKIEDAELSLESFKLFFNRVDGRK
jgi:hypothetical protein